MCKLAGNSQAYDASSNDLDQGVSLSLSCGIPLELGLRFKMS